MASAKRVSLFPILLVNFIGTLGFSIVLPFLVMLVTRFGGNALVYGAVGATYSALQLVGAPILGRWSDVQGRRKILLMSQLGTLASWFVFLGALFLPAVALFEVDSRLIGSFVLTLPLAVLFLARALDGLTGGNVSVANAYLADVTDPDERNVNFGKMAVAGNLGFIFGPTLAGLLGATAYGEAIPVMAALLSSLAASYVIAFHLPESNPCALGENPEQTNVRKVFGQEQVDCYKVEDKVTFKAVLKLEGVAFLLALYFVLFVAFNLFYTAFPVHAIRGLNWSITDIGLFFSFLGLTTVLVQGPLLSRVGKKVPDVILMLVGAIILAAAFVCFTSFHRAWLFLGVSLFSLGNGLMWPSFLAILSRVAGDKHQGAVQGFASSVGSAASILGLLLGGILYQTFHGNTFLVSAVCVVAVFLASFRLLPLAKRTAK